MHFPHEKAAGEKCKAQLARADSIKTKPTFMLCCCIFSSLFFLLLLLTYYYPPLILHRFSSLSLSSVFSTCFRCHRSSSSSSFSSSPFWHEWWFWFSNSVVHDHDACRMGFLLAARTHTLFQESRAIHYSDQANKRRKEG